MPKQKRRRTAKSRTYILMEPAHDPDDSTREEGRRAFEEARAEQDFGRSVPPILDDYREVVRSRGTDGLAAALIARANRRWENIVEGAPFAGSIVFPRIWRLPPLDYALSRLGVDYAVRPDWRFSTSHLGSPWPEQLRWGLDAVASAAKYLLLCQYIGAAALLRQQAERWTDNRAHALRLPRPEGMPRAAFMTAVWGEGYSRRIDIGAVYRTASEALHGRGPALDLIRWEAVDLAEWPPPAAAIHIGILSELSVLAQHQITACVLDLTRGNELSDVADLQIRWRDVGDPPGAAAYSPVTSTLLPLSPHLLASSVPRDLIPHGEIYERELEDPDPLRMPEASLAVLAYLHRRHRACQVAIYALEQEQKQLGSEFDLRSIASQETRYVLVAELGSLVGKWTGGHHGDALVVGASAVRSGFQLWLEDDTRAMIAARTIFESAARARTWRLKPARAAKLEERAETSGKDWFRAAGWSRLSFLGSALGELSHSAYDSRWDGALRALADLHGDEGRRLNTARGGTLSRATFMLAVESSAQLERLSPPIAEAARQLLGVSSETERWTEDWLRKTATSKEGFDFGKPIFRPFTAADLERIRQSTRAAPRQR